MPREGERFEPIAAIAACVLPGLGYLATGRIRRGIYVFIGVMGLFLTGILVGGIDAIDRREDPLWFYAQALTGPPAFAADYIHQAHLKVHDQGTIRHPTPAEWDAGRTGNGPRYARPAIGKVADAAALLVALAGMINLIAIIDCAVSRPGRDDDKPKPNNNRPGPNA